MSNKIFLCIACFLSTSLFAHEGLGIEGEEVEAIAHLIEMTTSQLTSQRELKSHMEQFSRLKKQFIQRKEEKKVGFQMVQVARKILDTLQEEHLQDLVPKPYIDELKFFSTLAKKT